MFTCINFFFARWEGVTFLLVNIPIANNAFDAAVPVTAVDSAPDEADRSRSEAFHGAVVF